VVKCVIATVTGMIAVTISMKMLQIVLTVWEKKKRSMRMNIKTCPECGKPFKRGMRVPNGKKTKTVCTKCGVKIQLQSEVNIKIDSKLIPKIEARSTPETKIEARSSVNIEARSRSYRLFVDQSTLNSFDRLARMHKDSKDSLFHLIVLTTDLDLPDREPEYFKDLTEVHLG
jgi:uncharacterized Zn finger protein (UPF0148 family)